MGLGRQRIVQKTDGMEESYNADSGQGNEQEKGLSLGVMSI